MTHRRMREIAASARVQGVFKAADSPARLATALRAACVMSACMTLLAAALAAQSMPARRIAAALEQFPAQHSPLSRGRHLPDARFASGLFVSTPPHDATIASAEQRP